MLTPILLIALFITMFAAMFALGAALVAPASALGLRLRTLLPTQNQVRKPSLEEKIDERMEQLSNVVPKSPAEVSTTRQWLMMAGYREPKHLAYYFGSRVLLAGATVLITVAFTNPFSEPWMLIGGIALAYMLPRFVLKRMIRTRQMNIRLGLPDALDLAVICVEAGLALDQTIQRVGSDLKHAHPYLSEEFNLVNLEMRAGKPRADALRNLASRTGVDDIRALVAVLVQTDRFGTSIAQALRVHSDGLRTERRQRAEEQAAKTTIKMVPVLVFFVFPSMFIISLGPAIIQLYRNLLPELAK